MKIFSFYHHATGLLTGHVFMTSNEDDGTLAANTPTDHVAIEGHHDPACRKIDIATGQPMDWQPPQPSADHEWDAGTKRWKLNAVVAAKQAQRADALAQIQALERSETRPHRELLLDPTNAEARSRLAAIDSQIAALRKLI